jgi:tetratricopeptide (TPR) repeat protein
MVRYGTLLAVAAFAVSAMGVAPLAANPAGAQATQTDAMSLPQNSDLKQRFGDMLVDKGRNLVIGPDADASQQRETLLRRAATYEAIKDYALAEREFTSALEVAPPTADFYVTRGFYFMRRGQFGDAIGDFLAGVRLDPGSARAQFGVARAQAALGHYADAIGYYDEAIKLFARDPTFYLARAEAFIHLHQPAKAKVDYDRALAIKLPLAGDRYYAYLGRGFASLQLSDYAGAIADLDNALTIEPRAVNALLWRGYARERGGQVALALDDYERAASVAPGDRVARANVQRLRSN